VAHGFSEEERHRILLTCSETNFAPLPPGQIVLSRVEKGLYICSERSFYRVLHARGQALWRSPATTTAQAASMSAG
jgi:putative transposase